MVVYETDRRCIVSTSIWIIISLAGRKVSLCTSMAFYSNGYLSISSAQYIKYIYNLDFEQ